MAAVTSAVILDPKKIKSVTAPTFSLSTCRGVMGTDAVILEFWKLSFKAAFSLFSFTLIKRFFSSSSLSASRVVLSAYLRFVIFLLAILIPACESSSLHFAWCTLHKVKYTEEQYIALLCSFPNFEPAVCSLLSLIHVSQETGKLVWYSHL